MFLPKKLIRISNIALAVLLLALLVLQLMPFWSFPVCTCTEGCDGAFVMNENCEACSIYYKWCCKLDRSQQAGLAEADIRDTTKPWAVSIQRFIWMPTFENTDGVLEYFDDMYSTKDYTFMVKDISLMPIMVFFFALIGAYFGLFKSQKPLWSIFGLVTGIYSTYTYLTAPIYQLGQYWQVHLGVAIAIAVVALIPTIEYIARAIRWLNPKAN